MSAESTASQPASRKKEKGIPFSDWGETAVAGWKQIFFYDPDGNIIEVHEKEVS